jgi:transcriptional regulator with XRE-family HTH domain
MESKEWTMKNNKELNKFKPNSIKLGKNMRALRKRTYMSQMGLAAQAGTELSTIHRIEAAKTDTNISTLSRIRKALKTDWDKLLEGV